MRKLTLVMHLTVDGYVAGPHGELDWMVHDPEMNADLWHEQRETVDLVLVGRKAHQGFEANFGGHVADQTSPPDLVEFSRWILDTPKVVFSRTLTPAAVGPSARLAEGDLPATIAGLKEQSGGEMVIFGGIHFAQQCVQHRLIDEYLFKIHPVAIGAGQSPFALVDARIDLRLVGAKGYRSGVNVVRYHPA
jgi:dihydrofolate reductase